jgi:transcriptional regulator with XRE-family HTH domain
MLKTKSVGARRFQLMALEHVEKRARRIKERREELGLTQEQVAERMQEAHMARQPDADPDRTRGQMVSDWERAVNDPRGYKLELLAEALGWTVADLEADQPNDDKDLLGQLSNGELPAEVVQAVERLRLELRQEIVEVRSQLLAEIERVRNAQAYRRSKKAQPERPRKSKSK